MCCRVHLPFFPWDTDAWKKVLISFGDHLQDHTSSLLAENGTYMDVRDYVPDLKSWKEGVALPARRKPQPSGNEQILSLFSLEDAEYARELRINGDFRLSSCHKLLRITPFKSTEHSRRMKSEGGNDQDQNDEARDYVIIGAWVFSGMAGVTNALERHSQLAKYLIAFMKSRGLRDTYTTICINHGGNRRVHRDLLNHEESMNHTIGLGGYQGGSVWVEDKEEFPIFSSRRFGWRQTQDHQGHGRQGGQRKGL